MDHSILVLGAGELGIEVLRSLAKHPRIQQGNYSISVLLRPSTIASTDPAKAAQNAEIKALSINTVLGDIVNASVSDLEKLFRPYATVVSCTGFIAGRGIQIKIATAVLKAGIKRYFPWQFGVDYDVIGRGSPQDLFDEQLDVRDLLRGQENTEWVIISTGMFTSFLFEPVFGVVDMNKSIVRGLGSLQTKVTVTTPEDIGKLTAEVLVAEPRIKNQVVYTAGDTISYMQVADVVEEVLGKKMTREVSAIETLDKELRQDPEDSIKKYRALFARGTGVSWELEKTFNAQRNIDVVDLRRWVRENLKQ